MVSKRSRSAKKAVATRRARQAAAAAAAAAGKNESSSTSTLPPEASKKVIEEVSEEDKLDLSGQLIEAVETQVAKDDGEDYRISGEKLVDQLATTKLSRKKLTNALNQCLLDGRLVEIRRDSSSESSESYLITPNRIEKMDIECEKIVPYKGEVSDDVVRDIISRLAEYDMRPPTAVRRVKVDHRAQRESAGFSCMQTRMLLNVERAYLNYTQETIRDKVFTRAHELGLVEPGLGTFDTPIIHLSSTFRKELGATLKPYDQTLANKMGKLTAPLHDKPIDQIWYDWDFVEKTMRGEQPLRPFVPVVNQTSETQIKVNNNSGKSQVVPSGEEVESVTINEQVATASSSASSTPAASPRPSSGGEETGLKRPSAEPSSVRASQRKRLKNSAYGDEYIGSYNELLQHRREIAMPKCCICGGLTKGSKKRHNLTEDFAPVVQCFTCNNVRVHLHCLRMPTNIMLSGLWKCCGCGKCAYCSHTKRKDFVINCKICTRGYHVTCLPTGDYAPSPFMCIECNRASMPTKVVPKVSVMTSEQSLLANRNRTSSGSSLIATRPSSTTTMSKSLLQQQQPSTSSATLSTSINHVALPSSASTSQQPIAAASINLNPNSLLATTASTSTLVTATPKTPTVTIGGRKLSPPSIGAMSKISVVNQPKPIPTVATNGTLKPVPMSKLVASTASTTKSLVTGPKRPQVNGTGINVPAPSTSTGNATSTGTLLSSVVSTAGGTLPTKKKKKNKEKKKKNKEKTGEKDKAGKDKENVKKLKKLKKKKLKLASGGETSIAAASTTTSVKKTILPGVPNLKSMVSPAHAPLVPKVPKVKDDFQRYLESEMKHWVTPEWYQKLQGLPKKILEWTTTEVCMFARALGLAEDEIPKITEHNVNGTALVGMAKNELREYAKLTIGSVSKLSRFTEQFTKTFEELDESDSE